MYSVMNYVTAKLCYLEKREHPWRTAASYLKPQWFLCTQAHPISSIFAKIPWRSSVHKRLIYFKSTQKKANCKELQNGEQRASHGEIGAKSKLSRRP